MGNGADTQFKKVMLQEAHSLLNPKIKRKLSPKIDIGDKMTYQETYNIVAANNSTIAQVLNQDTRTSEAYKPVVFIIVDDKRSFWSHIR